ncbi:hypothetical protein N8D56_08000 [Devosia sp. A8/3-2]|nr:hypothetical protein N8D56_08000 [Devosia sp. A8/3-2]
MRLSQSVFFGRDPELARALMAGKVEIRRLEAASSERHLKRVRALRSETLETSTLHLDILRDLKRINAHLASVAVAILGANGRAERKPAGASGQRGGWSGRGAGGAKVMAAKAQLMEKPRGRETLAGETPLDFAAQFATVPRRIGRTGTL